MKSKKFIHFFLILFFISFVFVTLSNKTVLNFYNKNFQNEGSKLPMVFIVIGTRPEAVKCSPLISLLKNEYYKKRLELVVLSTGQHRELLRETLNSFNQSVDIDLNLMTKNQDLSRFFEISFKKITDQFRANKNVKLVLVHGDTTTALAAALAASYLHIPIGHVEAGLRSYDLEIPFPEEGNRRIIDSISTLWFAPTFFAKKALLKESVCNSSIFVTGNTGIDAFYFFLSKKPAMVHPILNKINNLIAKQSRKIVILATMHRRENYNYVESMCMAIRNLGAKYKHNILIILPMHPNPNFQTKIKKILSNLSNVLLVDPISYDTFPHVLNASDIILSDSGGLQEEASTLGKPLLLMRNKTDRPEGVYHGLIKIIGTETFKIQSAVETIIDKIRVSAFKDSKRDIFGDGKASERIAHIIEQFLYTNLSIQNKQCSTVSRQNLIAKEVFENKIPLDFQN